MNKEGTKWNIFNSLRTNFDYKKTKISSNLTGKG